MSYKKYSFFAVAIICTFTLLFISVLLVYYYINIPSDTIIIQNVVLSDEIENKSRLTGTISRFSYGTRQMFVFFDFEKAQVGDSITLRWYYGDKEIRSDVYKLDETSGYRVFCLLKEDGSLLPRGAYSLKIMQGDKAVIPEYVFNIF
ncbi:MAG: hypothetical protein FWH52_00730 [Synergistaceae bacterium]|nr:hypothetical protein [Synergistaceae bacterium]